jgi:hypothetical protein
MYAIDNRSDRRLLFGRATTSPEQITTRAAILAGQRTLNSGVPVLLAQFCGSCFGARLQDPT